MHMTVYMYSKITCILASSCLLMTDEDSAADCDGAVKDDKEQCWSFWTLADTILTVCLSDVLSVLSIVWWDLITQSLTVSLASTVWCKSVGSDRVRLSEWPTLLSAHGHEWLSTYFRRRSFKNIASFSSCRNFANYNETNPQTHTHCINQQPFPDTLKLAISPTKQ